MRPIPFVLAALALMNASAAAAQLTPPPPPTAASTGAVSAVQPYTLDTPVETLASDPAAVAVLNKDIPGLLTHPAYASFKSRSLNDVAPLSDGRITDEMLAVVQKDLAALTPR